MNRFCKSNTKSAFRTRRNLKSFSRNRRSQKEQTLRSHVIWRNGTEVGISFEQSAPASSQPAEASGDLTDRVAKLEAEVASLKRLIKKLTAGDNDL